MSLKRVFWRSNPERGGQRPPAHMKKIKRAYRRPDLYSDYDVSLSNKGISSTEISSTGTQTYTVPRGVDTLTITMYGAGGGGGAALGGRNGTDNGIGAGSGAKCVFVLNDITKGTILSFDVGAGGAKSTGSNDGSDGGDTTLTYNGTTYTAGGGIAGVDAAQTCYGCGVGGTATNGDTNTSGNDKSAENGGASLGDSAGAGGDGSTDHSSQNNTDGGDGKVIIS
ncbi:TPA: hypothetical protein HA278_03775 [Candidatus Woesearchaeota archaeon]|nr:hypothetical protein [Candidatus Woesearchaeota archaeon]